MFVWKKEGSYYKYYIIISLGIVTNLIIIIGIITNLIIMGIITIIIGIISFLE
jgi:hypothetical protein